MRQWNASRFVGLLAAIALLTAASQAALASGGPAPSTGHALIAFAYVLPSGELAPDKERNIVSFDKDGDTGIYCFDLPFRPRNVVASPTWDGFESEPIAIIRVALQPNILDGHCPRIPHPDLEITAISPDFHEGFPHGFTMFASGWES